MKFIGMAFAVVATMLLVACGNGSTSSAISSSNGEKTVNLRVNNSNSESYTKVVVSDSADENVVLLSESFLCEVGASCDLKIPNSKSNSVTLRFYNSTGDLVGAWVSAVPLKVLLDKNPTQSYIYVNSTQNSLGFYIARSFASLKSANVIDVLSSFNKLYGFNSVFEKLASSFNIYSSKPGAQSLVSFVNFDEIAFPADTGGGETACTEGSAWNWMGCMQDTIGNRRLADIALPGTHDSGTTALDSTIARVGKTQILGPGVQLYDGIRYLDLRVRENPHYDCADSSVWKIYHMNDLGDPVLNTIVEGLGLGESYSLTEVLENVRGFLQSPQNSMGKEIIILDFQTIFPLAGTQSVDTMLSTVQSYLGPWLFDNSDPDYKWFGPLGNAKTLNQIWAANAAKGQTKQVIVLFDSDFAYPPKVCADYNTSLFMSRSEVLGPKVYNERADGLSLAVDVASQLTPNYPGQAKDYFTGYRDAQKKGLLNIQQIVSRPPNSWYRIVLDPYEPYGDQPQNLIDYAERLINPTFADFLPKLFSQAASSPDANTPNIVIIDSYVNTNLTWDRWGNFVNTVIGTNKLIQK